MPHAAEPWTVARWSELTPVEGRKFEVVDGELVVTGVPNPSHARAVQQMSRLLSAFLDAAGTGDLYQYWAPVILDQHNAYLPDLVVYEKGPGPGDRWEDVPPPALAVEVLSPTTARYDRGTKRMNYLRTGVTEYWIVDLDARLVERWQPGELRPEVARQNMTWHPRFTKQFLEVDLLAYFERVLGK